MKLAYVRFNLSLQKNSTMILSNNYVYISYGYLMANWTKHERDLQNETYLDIIRMYPGCPFRISQVHPELDFLWI